MSLNIGDKVIIRIKDRDSYHEMENGEGYGINNSMLDLEGREFTIKFITYSGRKYKDGTKMYRCKLEECSWSWNDRCFEVKPKDVVMF